MEITSNNGYKLQQYKLTTRTRMFMTQHIFFATRIIYQYDINAIQKIAKIVIAVDGKNCKLKLNYFRLFQFVKYQILIYFKFNLINVN